MRVVDGARGDGKRPLMVMVADEERREADSRP